MIDTGVAIYHDTPRSTPHRCEPRISATCAVCKQEYALCSISDQGVRDIMARIWTCGACRATLPDELPEPCATCGDPLSSGVVDAASVLYGTGRFDADGLIASIERMQDRAPDLTENDIAVLAIEDALGLTSIGDLVVAFRHYGHFGECRP